LVKTNKKIYSFGLKMVSGDFEILLQLVYNTAEPIGFEKLNYFNQ